MIQKFQKYLLENKPVYYQTKFWEMMAIAFFVWLFSWIFGFISVDIVVLQHSSIRNFYFGSFAVLHSIAVMIIYVIWALAFFKNNALKHFYPLSKFYHHKVFIQIFIPAILLISAYYPYTHGIIVRTKLILNKNELIQDALVINKAYPFLAQSKDDYNLDERVYPYPFPVNVVKKNDNNEWLQPSIYTKIKSTNDEVDTNNLVLLNPSACLNKTMIDGEEYILYLSHTESKQYDSCDIENYTIIDSFIIPSPSLVKHYRDVLNFSSVFIEENYQPIDTFSSLSEKEYYKKYFATDVYQIVNSRDAKTITSRIDAFLDVCNKYKIKHTLVPQTITDYLLKNDFKIRYGLITNSEFNIIYPDAAAATKDESPMVQTAREKNADDEKYLGYVEFESISNIYSNYNQALQYNFENGMYLVLIAVALLFATFILLAHSVDAVAGLLSLPVAGVILLINGLIAIAIHHDQSLMIIYFLISGFIVWYSYYVVRQSAVSKRIATIIVLLGFYALPSFVSFFFFIIHDFSKKTQTMKCSGNYEVYGYEPQPMHIILLCVVLLALQLPLLKKLKANADE